MNTIKSHTYASVYCVEQHSIRYNNNFKYGENSYDYITATDLLYTLLVVNH